MKFPVKIVLGVSAYLTVLAVLAVLTSLREEFGWLLVVFILATTFLGRRWANHWRRRAFDPATPEDRERALDRQILHGKVIVWSLLGVGALLAIAALAEAMTG